MTNWLSLVAIVLVSCSYCDVWTFWRPGNVLRTLGSVGLDRFWLLFTPTTLLHYSQPNYSCRQQPRSLYRFRNDSRAG